jgi:Zn-dependent alcohol dehydrogenase
MADAHASLLRLQFDQINEAFELLHAGKCLRVVLSL